MNFIRNRNFRAGPQTSLEGFICPQNSDKQQKIKVFRTVCGGHVLLIMQVKKSCVIWLYATSRLPLSVIIAGVALCISLVG